MDETEVTKIREARIRLKKQHAQLFNEISEILFRHDPIGINFEDNTDEYEPEVGTILPKLKEAQSATELRRIIHAEFVRWFSGDSLVGEEAKYENIAQEIWAVYQRYLK